LTTYSSHPGNTTSDSSLITFSGKNNILNLNPGANKFTIDLVNGSNSLQANETYTITLASILTAGNIYLNGQPVTHTSTITGLITNGTISSDLYKLQS